MFLSRLTALPVLAVVASLAPLGATASPMASAEPAAAPGARAAHAPYEATIRTTRHGIPHITADNFGSLGFGSGYAAASASVCTLADTLITARGQRSKWFGPDGTYNDQVTLDASNLQVDAFVADLHQRHVVEKLLADKVRGPGQQARAMVRGYTAGVNKYLAKVGPDGVTDPACRGKKYLEQRARPIDLWYGVYLANLLASSGVFVKEIVDADPPAPDDPGIPNPTAAAVDQDKLLAGLGKDPQSPFGSNATAIGGDATTTGKGMLLGNPHFPWRGRYHFTEQQLTIPGHYDVAGASLIGSPVVNIGWNKNVAWSHTVSTAYRFTPYEYRSAGPTSYVTDAGPQDLMHDDVTVTVRKSDGTLGKVKEDVYRTPEGFVIDAPALLMPWSATSVWAIRDANGEQLRTIDTFLDMGKARNVRDLIRRQDAGGGMPWVNTTAADRFGNALYADHSVVPNVPDAVAEACMTPTGRILDQLAGLPGLDGTRADSDCAWGTDADAERPGIFGPKNLPMEVRRDWVMNANDSYWLPNPAQPIEGYAGIIGCERCERTMRTRMVSHYVMDRLAAGKKESPRSLRGHEHENRVMAGEVMRANGDLDTLCSATGETEACQALHDWDGHSNVDSRGYAIFEEFIARLPAQGVWLTPFDASDPLNTPRDLNVANPQLVQAMSDAIAALRDKGIAFDATWGSLQVAGDRGAPAIPLGGGTGDAAGNANALASRWALQNKDHYRPITYGSSHIQAVAFLSGGRVDARTILTYGQSEDPTNPWSSDQTRMFSRKQWVHFAFTPAEIRRDLLSRVTIRG
ncbi:acyl-homoserine-lactone acylase [Nocardioides ginsengisegetis]|uniref:Acyl-homoserine-lactone acylase n=1 Tax=Nocardioides ginsengisegetis TaxID=661491 RepID=A0A7W3J1B3_9ACTN|nr:penicillin acylase family protein [Nocardioides ginsengisegetis]MBA8804349.1 acyl-homoserine-lactone acylase [Nocardioides ginsengisegetis]